MRQARVTCAMRRAVGALALATACATSSTCGSSSPTSPTEAPTANPTLPSALSGVWRGNLRVVNCYVTFSICDAEQTMPFVLRVTAGGPGFIGAFELDAPQYPASIIDVTGQSQPDGAVLLTGSRGRIPGNTATLDLRRLLVKVDGASGLTGEIDLRLFVTGSERSLIGRVTSASYQPFAPSGENVAGNWSGVAAIRSCSGYCLGSQSVGQSIRLSMVLGQSGTTVDGQLQLSNFWCVNCWLPLSGRLTGTGLTLSSPVVTRSPVFGDQKLHLETFEASLDQLHRLVGQFVYAADTRIAVSPFDVSYRLDCEILWLKRD